MVHEAFCIDSQGTYLWGVDDFLGDSLDARWESSGNAGGSAAVIDAQDGGVVRLTTNAVDNQYWIIRWGDIRSLHVDKKVTLEVKAKLVSVVGVLTRIRLDFDDDNFIQFQQDTDAAFTPDATSWYIGTENGGANTQQDSGSDIDTDYHIFKIECFPAGEVHFYIDGVECANSPITTNIPSDAADYLQPYIQLYSRNNDAKSIDIDYVQWRQDI